MTINDTTKIDFVLKSSSDKSVDGGSEDMQVKKEQDCAATSQEVKNEVENDDDTSKKSESGNFVPTISQKKIL